MKTLIIAEAGVNHNGSLETAMHLVRVAAEAGADIIKFQTFVTENIVSSNAPKADYQVKNTGNESGQFEMLKNLELSFSDHQKISDFCRKLNIQFLSTAFDLDSIDLLHQMNIPVWKIPSGEITNLPYLRKIGKMDKPVLLSTGMATLGEIESALNIIEGAGTKRELITILHCTTDYPANPDEINLRAMVTLGNTFNLRFGYSDHTDGVEIPFAAVAMGASVIEKHFTLDKNMEGPDHRASLDPSELKSMVSGIRKIERALGDGVKKPTPGEIKNIMAARKSIVASQPIRKGEIFSEENLAVKRPGNGLSPMIWDLIIGKQADRDYKKDEVIAK